MRKQIQQFLKQLETLSRLQCTDQEVCAILSMDDLTLAALKKREPKILEAIKKGRSEGLLSLRRAQFIAAIEKGNVTMQIWLGKQYLGQTDRQDVFASVAFEERATRWMRLEDTPVKIEDDIESPTVRH